MSQFEMNDVKIWEYSYARWNVLGNVLLFVPFGALMRGFAKKMRGALASFGVSFAASLGFEMIQFLYGIGEFDVDDIMLNVFGAILGYGFACIICHIADVWHRHATKSLPRSQQ